MNEQVLSVHLPSSRGFTLIEIISVLVILGILAAVAVPKYYDLQEESEKKAALSAVAEAQSRIHLSFGQQILQGKSCEDAVKEVSEITLLSDDGKSSLFGDFSLGTDESASGGEIVATGSPVYAKRGDAGTVIATGGSLYLPSCDYEVSVAKQFMDSTVKEMINYLFFYGNNDQSNEHGRHSKEFVDKYLKKFDLKNGVIAYADTDDGSLIGIKDSYVKLGMNFENKNTGERINIKFQQNKDGTISINQVSFWDENHTNGTKIVNSYNPVRNEATLGEAQQVAKNLGLNVNGLGATFSSTHPGKTIEMNTSDFTF